jgi:hypothetical protein
MKKILARSGDWSIVISNLSERERRDGRVTRGRKVVFLSGRVLENIKPPLTKPQQSTTADTHFTDIR